MSKQEKAAQKALAKHRQLHGTRDGQIHCACGWATQTKPGVSQQKSFRRHVVKHVLEAARQTEPETGHPQPQKRSHLVNKQIEASAKAIYEIREDKFSDDEWQELGSSDRELYVCQARTALAAADKVATITEPGQLAALSAGTRLESQVGQNFDYWNVHGDGLATCLSAVGYLGPVTEIMLPARVIHWGAE